MSTINAQMFIIPNPSTCLNQYADCNQCDMRVTMVNHFPANWQIQGDEPLVEIWTHNESSDNWACHGPDAHLVINNWPSYIPARILRGIKEEETVTVKVTDLDGNQITVNLVASQLTSRYRQFGTFQQAFRHVTGENKVIVNGSTIQIQEIDLTSISNESWASQAHSILEQADLLNNHQTAQIYLGNPGGTTYVNATVEAIYLGSLEGVTGFTHYWLNRHHDGGLMVSTTFGHGGADRSTCAGRCATTLQMTAEEIASYEAII